MWWISLRGTNGSPGHSGTAGTPSTGTSSNRTSCTRLPADGAEVANESSVRNKSAQVSVLLNALSSSFSYWNITVHPPHVDALRKSWHPRPRRDFWKHALMHIAQCVAERCLLVWNVLFIVHVISLIAVEQMIFKPLSVYVCVGDMLPNV